MGSADTVASRLIDVRRRIADAARSAGRRPEDVRLVAVTKKLGAPAVRAAYAAGQRDFGENYAQEGAAKAAELAGEMPDARWHLIGRLQSNKAALATRTFLLLHGIDSMRTVVAVARAVQAQGEDRMADLLLQVRLGGGDERAGVGEDEAEAFLLEAALRVREAAGSCAEAEDHAGVRFRRGICFRGLMAVADPAQETRPQFARLRLLAERLAALGIEGAPLGELSIGMTGDFEDAIAEGATIVRIGTAIFGDR